MNGTSTKGTNSFGYALYREGQRVSRGYCYDDAAGAKAAALREAQVNDTFLVGYKCGIQRWRVNRDGTATSFLA